MTKKTSGESAKIITSSKTTVFSPFPFLHKIIGVDLAWKKDIVLFDSETEKLTKISPTVDAIKKFIESLKEQTCLLVETGVGDTLKLLAFRAGHVVLEVSGKFVKAYRDEHEIEKSDENDAKAICNYYNEITSNRGSAINLVSKTIGLLPSPFRLFTEAQRQYTELKILYRDYDKFIRAQTRMKNQAVASKKRLEVVGVEKSFLAVVEDTDNGIISSYKSKYEELRKLMTKKLEQCEIWTNCLKKMKGFGPVCAAGLIGELGSTSPDTFEGAKHYSGLLPNELVGKKHNHYLKDLFLGEQKIVSQMILHRIQPWRDVYDNMKVHCAKKHSDWSKIKVERWVRKFVAQKIFKVVYDEMKKVSHVGEECSIDAAKSSQQNASSPTSHTEVLA